LKLKYLAVHVIAAKYLGGTFKSEIFYRTFKCIYSRSKTANSEMITVQLLMSYCLPLMLYAVEAVSLSTVNCHVVENCTNRALYRIFGSCDNQEFLRSCIGLDYMEVLSQQKYFRFDDGLVGDARYFLFAFNSLCF